MSYRATAALIGAFATTALAHGTVTSFTTDGIENGGFLLEYYYQGINGGTVPDIAAWHAENLDNGFVGPDEYGSSNINCHKNASPGPITASVAAGGTVDFKWTEWPESHFGPVFTYVAKCDGDCSDADVETLKWVKIDEAGIDIESQKWAATELIENNNTWTTTVPSTLAAGNYVFRHEIIAMHDAGRVGGAQNYPQCFNIEVTGSGTDNPEGVLGTALYTEDHSGINFNPYTTIESYEIPGPELYGSGGNGGSNPSPVDPPTVTPPTVTPPTVTPPVATPAPVEPEVPTPTETSSPAPIPEDPETIPEQPTTPEDPETTPEQPTTPEEPTTPAPEIPGVPEDGGDLPETFTLETFITWLRAKTGPSKTRRHARDLF